jgi:hypothetical protein
MILRSTVNIAHATSTKQASHRKRLSDATANFMFYFACGILHP